MKIVEMSRSEIIAKFCFGFLPLSVGLPDSGHAKKQGSRDRDGQNQARL
jgi:hypothetical protein